MTLSNPLRPCPGRRAALAAAPLLLGLALQVQAAPTYSDYGAVQRMEAGWSADTMSIWHGGAQLTNPGGCRVIDAGYATAPTDAGRALFHTVLLSAFLNRKEVALLIDGCVYDKPRIVAVSVR